MTGKRPEGKCDLCGLPLRYGNHTAVFGGQARRFCCGGCQMVYSMLMEAADSPDPASFHKSELYRRCVAAGVVPATEQDLADSIPPADDSKTRQPPSDPHREYLQLQLTVEGMWCPACSWVIQAALDRLGGVQEAACDFATDRLRCRYDPVQIEPTAIIQAIQSLGYRPTQDSASSKPSMWLSDFVRLIVSALLSANVMMLSWSLYSGIFSSLSAQDIDYISWPMAVMATGVLVYGGGPLFRKAWFGLRAGAPGMEALVCLGAASAYLCSLYNFRAGSWHLYFDTATMLITLVLLGKFLESRVKIRVRHDLEGFLALQPNKVRLCNQQFPEGRFVSLSQLAAGDRFRVRADETVPADGRVVAGQGWVDESALTGESRPKAVAAGHTLTSGSRMISRDVTVVAQRVGDDALVGQMIKIIETGLAQRTPLESRTDRWLALFVPVMAALATVTVVGGHALGLTWEEAFVRGLTVLVVACPCALGIAIPLARIAGLSRAGQSGILVRDFEAFERIHPIDHVVMDKTGTLTHGRWSLEQITAYGQWNSHDVLALAAGLEKEVDHTVARAVLAHTSREKVTPARVTDVKVQETGVTGWHHGRKVKIGSWDFMGQGNLPEPSAPEEHSPNSRIFLSVDDKVCACLGFGDRVRDSSAGLIQNLKQRGFDLHLISGDSQKASEAVGRQLGIEHIQGALLPKDKADYVRRLRHKGHGVVMVGDGINDAPALAVADLSVAVHRDAALAQQAAQVTLMRGDAAQLIDFWNLARRVNRKVQQNLVSAWIYNLVSIPIAMSGLLNPLIAATAMLLSSLTVICNTSLLIKKSAVPRKSSIKQRQKSPKQ